MKLKESASRIEVNDQETGLLLWQVFRLWEKNIKEVLARQEMTYLEYILMSRLVVMEKKDPNITQVKLATQACSEIMLTSKALRSLEDRGFIRRKKFSGDSRANLLNLTEKGHRKIEKTTKLVDAAENDFFAGLDGKRPLFSKNLAKVLQNNLAE